MSFTDPVIVKVVPVLSAIDSEIKIMKASGIERRDRCKRGTERWLFQRPQRTALHRI